MRFAGMRTAPLALTVALAAGAVACGGSDGDAGAPAPVAAGTDEQQVRATVERLGRHVEAGDIVAACDEMTRAAQERFAAIGERLAAIDQSFADRGGGAGTCADAFGAVLAGDVIEDYTPPILSVTVDGDRAVVVGDSSHDENDEPQRATLRREDGEWKVWKWYAN